MDDENIDGVSPERIANLIAEAEAGYDPDKLIPRPTDRYPPLIDGIRRCKVDIQDHNYMQIWDLAGRRDMTFDEALNWMIAHTTQWLDGRDNT